MNVQSEIHLNSQDIMEACRAYVRAFGLTPIGAERLELIKISPDAMSRPESVEYVVQVTAGKSAASMLKPSVN